MATNLRMFQNSLLAHNARLRWFPCREETKRKVIAACVLTDPALWTARSEKDAREALKRQVMTRCRVHKVGNPLILIALISLAIQIIWIWWQWKNSEGSDVRVAAEVFWTDMACEAMNELES